MSLLLLAALFLVPLTFIGLTIAAKTTSGAAATWSKGLTIVPALPMLAFFVFGFLASFEGSDSYFWIFRILYTALFLIVSATLVYVWLPSKAVIAVRDDVE